MNPKKFYYAKKQFDFVKSLYEHVTTISSSEFDGESFKVSPEFVYDVEKALSDYLSSLDYKLKYLQENESV